MVMWKLGRTFGEEAAKSFFDCAEKQVFSPDRGAKTVFFGLVD